MFCIKCGVNNDEDAAFCKEFMSKLMPDDGVLN